jgi:K+-transporting ATPase KdpF subunit
MGGVIGDVGCPHHPADALVVCGDSLDGPRPHPLDGAVIRVVILASILSVGLFLYLIIALLKPEWFV